MRMMIVMMLTTLLQESTFTDWMIAKDQRMAGWGGEAMMLPQPWCIMGFCVFFRSSRTELV